MHLENDYFIVIGYRFEHDSTCLYMVENVKVFGLYSDLEKAENCIKNEFKIPLNENIDIYKQYGRTDLDYNYYFTRDYYGMRIVRINEVDSILKKNNIFDIEIPRESELNKSEQIHGLVSGDLSSAEDDIVSSDTN